MCDSYGKALKSALDALTQAESAKRSASKKVEEAEEPVDRLQLTLDSLGPKIAGVKGAQQGGVVDRDELKKSLEAAKKHLTSTTLSLALAHDSVGVAQGGVEKAKGEAVKAGIHIEEAMGTVAVALAMGGASGTNSSSSSSGGVNVALRCAVEEGALPLMMRVAKAFPTLTFPVVSGAGGGGLLEVLQAASE